jgi:hypothetical protein
VREAASAGGRLRRRLALASGGTTR